MWPFQLVQVCRNPFQHWNSFHQICLYYKIYICMCAQTARPTCMHLRLLTTTSCSLFVEMARDSGSGCYCQPASQPTTTTATTKHCEFFICMLMYLQHFYLTPAATGDSTHEQGGQISGTRYNRQQKSLPFPLRDAVTRDERPKVSGRQTQPTRPPSPTRHTKHLHEPKRWQFTTLLYCSSRTVRCVFSTTAEDPAVPSSTHAKMHVVRAIATLCPAHSVYHPPETINDGNSRVLPPPIHRYYRTTNTTTSTAYSGKAVRTYLSTSPYVAVTT